MAKDFGILGISNLEYEQVPDTRPLGRYLFDPSRKSSGILHKGRDKLIKMTKGGWEKTRPEEVT